MKFSTWLESRQFGRLVPQETLALVPQLKQMARDLTAKYDQDPFVSNRQVHIEEWQKRKIHPAQGILLPMPVWHLWRSPKQKRRFVSILSNELF